MRRQESVGAEPSRSSLTAYAPDPFGLGVGPVLRRLQGLQLISRQRLRRSPAKSQRETLRGGQVRRDAVVGSHAESVLPERRLGQAVTIAWVTGRRRGRGDRLPRRRSRLALDDGGQAGPSMGQ